MYQSLVDGWGQVGCCAIGRTYESPTFVHVPNCTHTFLRVTDVTHDDRKSHVTTITRALQPQWERYLIKQTQSRGESDRQTLGMEKATKCKHVLVTLPPVSFTLSRGRPPDDHPHCRPTHQALSNSCLEVGYLWLAIAKAVSRCPGRLKLFDASKMCGARMHLSGIKQLQSFECCREWRDVTRDKLAVGIGFHMRTCTPGVCVSLYQCLPWSVSQALLCNPMLTHA